MVILKSTAIQNTFNFPDSLDEKKSKKRNITNNLKVEYLKVKTDEKNISESQPTK